MPEELRETSQMGSPVDGRIAYNQIRALCGFRENVSDQSDKVLLEVVKG